MRHVNSTRAGVCAFETLHERKVLTGEVIAVFQSAFYCRFGDRLICVTNADVDPGPLSLCTTFPASSDWRHLVCVGQRANFALGNQLRLPRVSIAFGQARRVGAVLTGPVARGGLAKTLRQVEGLARTDAGHDGFGPLWADGTPRIDKPVAVKARPLVRAAQNWLRDPGSCPPDWAVALVGLGPGLTPSGDDFLAGVMIGLRRVGRTEHAERIWGHIQPHLDDRTNEISAALLAAAARGHGSMALHRVLEDLISDRDVTRATLKLGAQGHTSGWDAALGMVTALRSETQTALQAG